MLTIHLDSRLPLPLYEQIYLHIRTAIRSGLLNEQERLPSTRALAAHLSVSRNTVDMAYSQLLSEGYIEARPKSGFYVCPILELEPGWEEQAPGAATASPAALLPPADPHGHFQNHFAIKAPCQEASSALRYDFSPFASNTAGFPYRIWQRLSARVLSEHGNELFLLGDRQGEPELRIAVAKYLYEARGVSCDPSHIIIGAGADYLLQLLIQLLGFPKLIAMENPCYIQAARILRGFGCQLLPLPLDENGLSYEALRYSPARIVYLTPSHQYPLGLVMPAGRRQELLRWAAATGAYLIEDDHGSEFRYRGRPIPALKEMDSSDSVIHIGTFSRAIAPAIRAGYMVLPDALFQNYCQRFSHYASTVSRIDQMILTHFLAEGYLERHLNKSRTLYKARHDALLQALRIFGRQITVTGDHAGLHLAVQFLDQPSEHTIIETAKQADIRLYGLSAHYLEPAPAYPPTILFGFGNLEETDIREGIRRLWEVLL